MVLLQIFGRSIILIIVTSNILQGYGYSETEEGNELILYTSFCYKHLSVIKIIIFKLLIIRFSSVYIRKEDALNDMPDSSAVNDFYNVKSRKGGRRVFAGGCIRRPNGPVNGKITCSLDRYIYK